MRIRKGKRIPRGDGKRIEELVGPRSTGTDAVSVAIEPAQARRRQSRVVVDEAHPQASAHARRLAALGRRYMALLELGGRELSLSLVGDAAIRRLNRTWRKKDTPTDVLSFPADPLPKGTPGPQPLGDVVISLDTAKRQAKEEGRPLKEELARYLAHGLLHLLGYDHERSPAEARKMAALEEELLGARGMVADSLRGGGRAGATGPRSSRARVRSRRDRRT